MENQAMNVVALGCVVVLGLLLFGLGLAVSVRRFRSNTGSGQAADPTDPLNKLVRAHANTAEYAPFMAVLFLYLGTRSPSAPVVGLMVAATLCRCVLVFGLVAWPSMSRSNPARAVGALGTYVCGVALTLALLA